MGNKSIYDALSALIDCDFQPEHFDEYQQQTNTEKNDRGAAILIAANLENVLEFAIERRLRTGPELRKELFGFNSPIDGLSDKTIIANALRIIGPETRKNLDTIRRIRNAFAHAKIPILFTTPAVANACTLLTIPPLFPPVAIPSDRSQIPNVELTKGRLRFQAVCDRIVHDLYVVSMPGLRGEAYRSDPLHGSALMPRTPESLP